MSDSCKVTARVTLLFPADLWFSSRERSPNVALDFEDFVHRVVSIHAPFGPSAFARIESQMAHYAAAKVYSFRMIPELDNRVAELVRASAGRVDDRLY